jgi:hypothetical protein
MPKNLNNVIPVTADDWETISGLIDKQDAYMVNCRFGFKDEYTKVIAQAVGGPGATPGKGAMFLTDWADTEGNVVASQGYSIGSGWIISDDGLSISHPTRGFMVKTSVYGQFIDTVVKGLKVDMKQYGSPLRADTWERLGFYVEQKDHKTLEAGKTKSAAMPTKFIGVMTDAIYATYLKNKAESGAQAQMGSGPVGASTQPNAQASAKNVVTIPANIEAQLSAFAQLPQKAFLQKALTINDVATNDVLLSIVLDTGAQGYWQTHHGK